MASADVYINPFSSIDKVSVENGTIVCSSSRWPLLIGSIPINLFPCTLTPFVFPFFSLRGYPLNKISCTFLDPQLQGIKWLRQRESDPERNLQVVRLGQSDLLRKLEKALEYRYTILSEHIGDSLDAVLNPVIQRAVIKRGKKSYIKLGDTEVEFNKNFKLFLHTKLSNPVVKCPIYLNDIIIRIKTLFIALSSRDSSRMHSD